MGLEINLISQKVALFPTVQKSLIEIHWKLTFSNISPYKTFRMTYTFLDPIVWEQFWSYKISIEMEEILCTIDFFDFETEVLQ